MEGITEESPFLSQGGYEVSFELTVTMSASVVNHLPLTRYEKLLKELYIEPKNKEIVRTFLSVVNEEEKQAEGKSRQQKKATGEAKSKIKGDTRYVAKPNTKKG